MLPMNFVFHDHFPTSFVHIKPISKQEKWINVPAIIGDSRSSCLPPLNIQFTLCIQQQFWYTQPNGLESVLIHTTRPEGSTKSFVINGHLRDIILYHKLDHSISDLFVHWKDEFKDQYHAILEHTTSELQRLIMTEETSLGVCVDVLLEIDHVCDGTILLASEQVSVDGMVPASKSSIELLEPMEVDEININDECMVCLEEIGEEVQVLQLPCSHMFHGECITKWLEKSHYCPLCRFEMPTD